MAWGYNVAGQLGDGTTTNSDVPVAVSGLSEVAAISGGKFHSLALLSNGTVKAWGFNLGGELGDGTSAGPEACGLAGACSKTPVAVCAGSVPGPCPTGPYLSEVTAISGGGNHSLALLKNGTVKAWGLNGSGQLGDGTTIGPGSCGILGSCSTTPVTVCAAGPEIPCPTGPYLSNVTGVATGDAHSLAVVEPPAERPTVTGVEPNHGPAAGGTSVSITGTNFTGATSVKFGSTNAASFKVNSDTSITAVSPAGTGTVDVTVTTPSGTSATSSADRFTYGPTVSKLEPNHGSPSGGTSVMITGTGFTGATAVKFGASNAATFTVNSATSITAVSPKGMGTGTVDVTVTTPAGTSPTSSADQFTYMKK
jgi:hypothetical protein